MAILAYLAFWGAHFWFLVIVPVQCLKVCTVFAGFRRLNDLEDRYHDLQTGVAKKEESLHQTQVSWNLNVSLFSGLLSCIGKCLLFITSGNQISLVGSPPPPKKKNYWLVNTDRFSLLSCSGGSGQENELWAVHAVCDWRNKVSLITWNHSWLFKHYNLVCFCSFVPCV